MTAELLVFAVHAALQLPRQALDQPAAAASPLAPTPASELNRLTIAAAEQNRPDDLLASGALP